MEQSPVLLGLTVTVVGLLTVFFALTALIGALYALDRLVNGTREERVSPRGEDGEQIIGVSINNLAPESNRASLHKVAIAAFAMHQAARVSVTPADPNSSWRTAGRLRAVQRTPKG